MFAKLTKKTNNNDDNKNKKQNQLSGALTVELCTTVLLTTALP